MNHLFLHWQTVVVELRKKVLDSPVVVLEIIDGLGTVTLKYAKLRPERARLP